jgi:hypothetical protein
MISHSMEQAEAADVTDGASDAEALVAFLRERDVACPLCRYNLRGLASARCPECGRELRLSVGLLEPRQGAWLMAQISVAAGAGIGLLAIGSIMMHGWPQVAQRQALFNLAFTWYLGSIPLAAAAFALRRRYLQLAPARQWLIAAAAAVVTTMSIASVVLTG